MSKWLLGRLFIGTDQPVPHFAFQGSINWMRALAILSDTDPLSDVSLRVKYQTVVRRLPVDIDSDTCIFESLLKAMHNLSALGNLLNITCKYDIVRSAIIAWYYCIYFASHAMIFAASNEKPETHSKTDKVWHSNIVNRNLAAGIFGLHLTQTVPSSVRQAIHTLRSGNVLDLNDYPTNEPMALGCVYAYLKGTAKFEQDFIETRIRASKEFRDLGVTNFRKVVARKLRDAQLIRRQVNFLTQAFRYRGKANYRDSIYLSYGDDYSVKMDQFILDLEKVANKFLRMSIIYVNRRVEAGSWDLFVGDLTANARISYDPALLEC